jgi:flagellar biogenesis protein FliO
MMFLAQESAIPGALGSSAGFNIWQSLGGLLLVFGLLILSLKLLGRLNRRRNHGKTGLLAVWPLGPKREIQVLRLGDEVHYIYRHEGAMVLLKQETMAQWEQAQARDEAESPGTRSPGIFPRGFALSFKP